MLKKKVCVRSMLCALLITVSYRSFSQTDIDAITMSKNNFCSGIMYSYSSWDHYWEGTFKRNNANLGTVSTQMVGVMGNFGISNKLNFLFGAPYVSTKASAGQLHPMKGVQDLSLWIKWLPYQKKLGKDAMLSLFAIGGYSLPLSNYTPDFLPMSIGLHSRSLSLRGMADYQIGDWFATFSGTYVRRENIELDRQTYYTTEMHYTNEVKMPDATNFNLRAGFRDQHWIAELVGNRWTTLGGFDITKNNMPFPSNRMNATTVGANFKYEFGRKLRGFSLTGGGNTVVNGRNVGKATTYNAGIFYAFKMIK